jgi:hypothetical protein
VAEHSQLGNLILVPVAVCCYFSGCFWPIRPI